MSGRYWVNRQLKYTRDIQLQPKTKQLSSHQFSASPQLIHCHCPGVFVIQKALEYHCAEVVLCLCKNQRRAFQENRPVWADGNLYGQVRIVQQTKQVNFNKWYLGMEGILRNEMDSSSGRPLPWSSLGRSDLTLGWESSSEWWILPHCCVLRTQCSTLSISHASQREEKHPGTQWRSAGGTPFFSHYALFTSELDGIHCLPPCLLETQDP